MKKTKLKNIFSIFFCTMLVSTSVLSGCSRSEVHSNESASIAGEETAVDNSETKNITVAGWYEPSCTRNLMAYLAEKFPDYSFEYQYISKTSYEPLIDSQLSSKTAPDIVMVSQSMAKKHGKSGYIEDLTKYCDDFTDEGRDAFLYEDVIYAIPSTTGYICIFYNKTILKENGQSIPTTFEGLLDLADYMEQIGIKPMSSGLKDVERVADSAIAVLASGYLSTEEGKGFGTRIAEGETSFRKEIRPHMGKWQNLVIHHYYTKDMCLMDDRAAIDEFASEKSLMYCGDLEDYNLIKERNPDIKLGTMAFSSEMKLKPVLIGGCNCGFAVNSYSDKKNDAISIVADLATREGQEALWKDRKGSQTYLKNVKFDNPDEYDSLRPVVDSGRMFMPWNEWGKNSTEIYRAFGGELQKVILGERSMEIAFNVIDDEVRQIHKENN
ncbi:ABC transporter substrate-binding protein [Butyrivibrio sp. YAB3001]|uniref:ABC transporter substrate-binding protein n=1 Tax=Butyrivibrio sp. YAB3001 TaxID=1520812 RepID=UPI0015880F07|nr:extracellular solute-binding protein [Butyrivibrio sp. YAB3001]